MRSILSDLDLVPRLTAHRVVNPYGIGVYAFSRSTAEVEVEVHLGSGPAGVVNPYGIGTYAASLSTAPSYPQFIHKP